MKTKWILVLVAFILISALTLTGCEMGEEGFDFIEWLMNFFNGA